MCHDWKLAAENVLRKNIDKKVAVFRPNFDLCQQTGEILGNVFRIIIPIQENNNRLINCIFILFLQNYRVGSEVERQHLVGCISSKF